MGAIIPNSQKKESEYIRQISDVERAIKGCEHTIQSSYYQLDNIKNRVTSDSDLDEGVMKNLCSFCDKMANKIKSIALDKKE